MRVKKLKYIVLFVVGVFAVFTLIWSRQYFRLLPAHGSTSSNLVIFDDQLASNFSNWSWGSSVNLSNSSPVYSGSKSITFTPSAWGGFYVHTDTTIDLTQYASFQFAMQSSDSDKNFTLIFYDTNNQQAKTLPLSQFSPFTQNGWNIYTIPTSSLPSSIKGFALQETSGNAGPTTYLDAMQLIASQPAQQTTTTLQANQIFTDSLAQGWTNWSWNSSINLTNTSPVAQGTDSIAFTPTAGYAGLYLHTDTGIDTTPYTTLTFDAQASATGETFAVGTYDATNQLLHPVISLDQYGGQPGSTWRTYNVPLADLNATGKTIKGIVIQDISNTSGQPLYIDNIALSTTTTAQATQATPTAAPVAASQNTSSTITASSGDPLSGMPFFNDTSNDPATQQEQQWQSSQPANASLIAKIANQPKAIWMGGWSGDIQTAVQNEMNKAQQVNSLPIFVAYNIPQRDCGSYSAGGESSPQAYQSWIDGFAAAIGGRRAAVVLEPDALAQITCLSQTDQQTRYSLLSYAVQKFKSLGQTAVYLDAGNAAWIGASDIANRLKNADVNQADGFALNVSNFDTDQASITYGQQVSSQIQNKHFVIDTSRNGNGPSPDNAWCNPSGRALGDKPTTQTGNSQVDAYIWIKYPGESDGSCNGAPAAGVWYPNYALGLAQNAQW